MAAAIGAPLAFRPARTGDGGRRGYWYGGVWYWGPAVGVCGGSCYLNCINAGFGPGYCNAYAPNFCY